jgi:cell division protein FtsW
MKIFGDRAFSIIVLILVIGGTALFFSASLGLLARADSSPWRLVVSQVGLGLIPGFILLFVFRFMPPKTLIKLVVPIYISSLILSVLVFVPHIGLTLNGASRWIDLGFATFQPGEMLKVSVILMLSAYLAKIKDKVKDLRQGLLPIAGIVGIPCVLLLLQPNTSTVLVIVASCGILYLIS